MTVLQLITSRQTRGAETFAIQLAAALTQRGHRLIVAALYAPADTPPLISDAVEVIDLSQLKPRTVPYYSVIHRLALLVRQQKVDVVQANASDNLKYAVLSRKLFGWKSLLVYRNASVMSSWVYNRVHLTLYRYILGSVDAIASVSSMSKEDIENTFSISPSRVHRLTIATPIPEQISRSKARINLEQATGNSLEKGTKLIFHVGAFTWEKNHRGLLSVFKKIKGQLGGAVKLVSIGSGPLLDDIVAFNDDPDVVFLGYRTDVPDLLPAADLLLLTSKIEGTPGVILEAAANRVVSLSYLVGAVLECLPHNLGSVLTIPFGEEGKMAQKAVDLLKDDERRSAYAKQLQDFVSAEFSIDAVAKQFEALYYNAGNLTAHVSD